MSLRTDDLTPVPLQNLIYLDFAPSNCSAPTIYHRLDIVPPSGRACSQFGNLVLAGKTKKLFLQAVVKLATTRHWHLFGRERKIRKGRKTESHRG